jgi:hypothetical protein
MDKPFNYNEKYYKDGVNILHKKFNENTNDKCGSGGFYVTNITLASFGMDISLIQHP